MGMIVYKTGGDVDKSHTGYRQVMLHGGIDSSVFVRWRMRRKTLQEKVWRIHEISDKFYYYGMNVQSIDRTKKKSLIQALNDEIFLFHEILRN